VLAKSPDERRKVLLDALRHHMACLAYREVYAIESDLRGGLRQVLSLQEKEMLREDRYFHRTLFSIRPRVYRGGA
jgi:hypothetical protein